MQKNLTLEDEVRHLKAAVEQFPAEVKMNHHEASNIAYIHSFANAIRAVHRPDLDLAEAQAKMKEILSSYMQANPAKPDSQHPLADLKDYGCDFSFLLPTAQFYDPKELLMGMGVEDAGDDEDSEVADKEGEEEADEAEEGNARTKVPEVGKDTFEAAGADVGQTSAIPFEGTLGVPPAN